MLAATTFAALPSALLELMVRPIACSISPPALVRLSTTISAKALVGLPEALVSLGWSMERWKNLPSTSTTLELRVEGSVMSCRACVQVEAW